MEKHTHTHEHTHCHDHEHCHDHNHEHTHQHTHGDLECSCDCNDEKGTNKDEKILKVLLSHWVEHNKSHEEGFKEWIGKTKAMKKDETAACIQKAVEFMEKADEMLMEAGKTI